MKITELASLSEPSDRHHDGHLTLGNHRVTWTLSFVQGQLLYATDRRHAARRWDRIVKKYFPVCHWQTDIAQLPSHDNWQIRLLDQGIHRQQLSLIRAKLVIRHAIQEGLFELSQCDRLKCSWTEAALPVSRISQGLALSQWESKMVFNQVAHLQQQWQDAGLDSLSPTLSPTLKKTTKARDLPSLPVEHQYLRGDFTLWELAGKLDVSLVELIRSLQPLVEQQSLEFQPLPDFPLPVAPPAEIAPETLPPEGVSSPDTVSASPTSAAIAPTETPLVACIDDSPVLAHSLKKILTGGGYRTLIIQEPMRGFSQLIEHKPDLILLDLMLPNADGYSVCKFLRDTPVFAKTPIIVLTGKSKPIDRVRARMAGATEFLVKPPEPEQLLAMLHEHLADDPAEEYAPAVPGLA